MVLASPGLQDDIHFSGQQVFVSKSGKRHSMAIFMLVNFGCIHYIVRRVGKQFKP